MPNNEIQAAQIESELIRLRARGYTYEQIGQELRITAGDAAGRISKLAKATRARNQQISDEAFQNHVERLRDIWARTIQPALDRLAGSGGFDHQLVTAAIKLMEREAKMLGLDKGAIKSDDFYTTRTREELTGYAKEYSELTGYKFPPGVLQ